MRTLSARTDKELAALLKQGCSNAFSEIYTRYWDRIFITAESLLGNRPCSQDCAQEVFGALWKRRSIANISNLESYLQQASRFQAYKYMRSKQLERKFTSFSAAGMTAGSQDDPLYLNNCKITTCSYSCAFRRTSGIFFTCTGKVS